MTLNPNPAAFILPNWAAPSNIRAMMTTRHAPVTRSLNSTMARGGAYDHFNLATHVGDALSSVEANRHLLCEALSLPTPPIWLEQVHSNTVVKADTHALNAKADASFSTEKKVVCAIMTADCLPVLMCSSDGQKIAAVHAGWRGLASGIISHTIVALETNDIMVWLGAAIGPSCFEVGGEVREIFLQKSLDYSMAFHALNESTWLADIYQLARIELAQLGIFSVYGGEFCTMSDADTFYSYRRDKHTGRMATLIWRT